MRLHLPGDGVGALLPGPVSLGGLSVGGGLEALARRADLLEEDPQLPRLPSLPSTLLHCPEPDEVCSSPTRDI